MSARSQQNKTVRWNLTGRWQPEPEEENVKRSANGTSITVPAPGSTSILSPKPLLRSRLQRPGTSTTDCTRAFSSSILGPALGSQERAQGQTHLLTRSSPTQGYSGIARKAAQNSLRIA
ncbi:UNVERIFIED_CONTAM: hypothetical protein K2H54_015732 [Gekko kuhli]